MRAISAAAISAFLACAVAGCAGTPPPGEQASAGASAGKHARCEQVTGSMLCGNADDQPYGSLNAPNGFSPKQNAPTSSGKQ